MDGLEKKPISGKLQDSSGWFFCPFFFRVLGWFTKNNSKGFFWGSGSFSQVELIGWQTLFCLFDWRQNKNVKKKKPGVKIMMFNLWGIFHRHSALQTLLYQKCLEVNEGHLGGIPLTKLALGWWPRLSPRKNWFLVSSQPLLFRFGHKFLDGGFNSFEKY